MDLSVEDFRKANVNLTDITVELFEEENYFDKIGVYISHDGSSGCEYYVDKVSEIGNLVNQYIIDYYLNEKDNQNDD